MLKLILSAKAPHSALFRVNIDIQATKPIVHIKAPRKLKKVRHQMLINSIFCVPGNN